LLNKVMKNRKIILPNMYQTKNKKLLTNLTC
jgi:hypothetical protein